MNNVKGYINPEILQAAIEQWGIPAQIEMIQEECLELVLALQKQKRIFSARTNEAIVDEIADVKIMLAQAEEIFPKDLINARIDFKMKRLKERLEL